MDIGTRVAGKIAIVTGAASADSMGFAISRALAREGARVLLTDIDPRVHERSDALRAQGLDTMAMGHDVTSEAGWEAVLVAVGGTLDILVNNAGVSILKPLEAVSLDEFEKQIRINLNSVFLGCRMAVGAMRRTGRRGSIINIASLAADVGMPNGTSYAASKGGVRQLTKTVALETARDGIRCNSLHPGLIKTEIHNVGWRDNPTGMKAFADAIPMGHMGEPDDIAYCALFLASDEAKYITGADFIVDGGLLAQ